MIQQILIVFSLLTFSDLSIIQDPSIFIISHLKLCLEHGQILDNINIRNTYHALYRIPVCKVHNIISKFQWTSEKNVEFFKPAGQIVIQFPQDQTSSLYTTLLTSTVFGFNITFTYFSTGYSGQKCLYESYFISESSESMEELILSRNSSYIRQNESNVSGYCGIRSRFSLVYLTSQLFTFAHSHGNYIYEIIINYQ